MKKLGILIVLLALSFSTYAQKIKIKKGTVYVNKKEFLKIDREFGNETVTSLDDEVIFTIKYYSFDKPNPARNNTNDPNRFKYPAMIKQHYSVISFLDFDLKYETNLTRKKLFKAMYKYKLMTKDNKVSENNARKIGELISKEISGNIPVVIYTN